jgi:xanthine/CO dehydrogenase XdhC/CoxF family maturation factor
MLIATDRWVSGCVSGGCLEDDIARKAWWRTESGPALVSYDSTIAPDADPDEVREGFGLGCGGIVDILLERWSPANRLDPLELAARSTQTQQRCAVATVFRSEMAAVGVGTRVALIGSEPELAGAELPSAVRDEIVTGLHAVVTHGRSASLAIVTPHGAFDVLLEAVRPPPRVFVFGAGHDVIPLVQLTRLLGWEVVLCTKRARNSMLDGIAVADEVVVGAPAEIASRIRATDRAFALVMNHSLETDRECLEMLLGTHISYIGVLGPRARTRRLLSSLEVGERDPRIHAPVGLELGAETPAEIALAIVGEIQATLAHAPATRLRDRVRPIHELQDFGPIPRRFVTR